MIVADRSPLVVWTFTDSACTTTFSVTCPDFHRDGGKARRSGGVQDEARGFVVLQAGQCHAQRVAAGDHVGDEERAVRVRHHRRRRRRRLVLDRHGRARKHTFAAVRDGPANLPRQSLGAERPRCCTQNRQQGEQTKPLSSTQSHEPPPSRLPGARFRETGATLHGQGGQIKPNSPKGQVFHAMKRFRTGKHRRFRVGRLAGMLHIAVQNARVVGLSPALRVRLQSNLRRIESLTHREDTPRNPPPGGHPRSGAGPGSQPGGRDREAGPRLCDRRGQHRLGRLPVADRLRFERHRPGWHARRARCRRTRTIPTATASSRRSPPPASSCSCSSRSRNRALGAAAFSSYAGPPSRCSLFVVMLVTLGVNIWVVRYERRQARLHNSELLLAERSTRARTSTRRSACWWRWRACGLGYPMLDPIGGNVHRGAIARTGLRDRARHVGDPLRPRRDRRGRHPPRGDERARRTRLPSHPHARTDDHVFLDLHVWFPADARLAEAHTVSHVVKDRLMEKFPADRRRDHSHRTAAYRLAYGSPICSSVGSSG